MPGPENKSGKMNQSNSGSKINNLETNTKTEDLALAETMYMTQKKDIEITDDIVQDAIVYENGATSIDFMLPEEEREILEKNLNNYSDMEKMQKALSMAKKNKLLHEDVQSLNQIAKADELINNMFDIMNDPRNLEMINEYIRQKLESGQDVAKAYKEIGLMNKAMMDAREGMINKMKAGKSGKNAKIALKFTNGDGEETQIGVSLDG
jgi:hypothetical protein